MHVGNVDDGFLGLIRVAYACGELQRIRDVPVAGQEQRDHLGLPVLILEVVIGVAGQEIGSEPGRIAWGIEDEVGRVLIGFESLLQVLVVDAAHEVQRAAEAAGDADLLGEGLVDVPVQAVVDAPVRAGVLVQLHVVEVDDAGDGCQRYGVGQVPVHLQ